jgi:hypothetical protein
MPNWITNFVCVKGKKQDIQELIDFVDGTNREFDFDKIVPQPIDLVDGIKEWREKNWGCYFNAQAGPEVYIMRWKWIRPNECQIIFDTPWTSPYPVFKKLQELFPAVKLRVIWQDEMWLKRNQFEKGFGFE